jgi:hypothetical protein
MIDKNFQLRKWFEKTNNRMMIKVYKKIKWNQQIIWYFWFFTTKKCFPSKIKEKYFSKNQTKFFFDWKMFHWSIFLMVNKYRKAWIVVFMKQIRPKPSNILPGQKRFLHLSTWISIATLPLFAFGWC